MPTIPPKASPATSALEEHWPEQQRCVRALQPHHTQASEQLGRTYTAHCNTLFIEIAKTDKCSGTVILFAHRVFILYIF